MAKQTLIAFRNVGWRGVHDDRWQAAACRKLCRLRRRPTASCLRPRLPPNRLACGERNMADQNSALTIVLNHPDAESYARLIGERFPQIRAIIAPDPGRLERYIGEADALLAFRFPVEVFDQAKKLRWFQCTSAGV